VLAFALPRLGSALDHIATDAAAREVTSALAAGRGAALAQGRRVRVRITGDSIGLDTLGDGGAWGLWRARPGPVSRGVTVVASNPSVVFAPTGITWGVSNTSVKLMRGSHVETVVVSRLGRVRRA
jgi:Tfp pilus assembly protein FimT